MGCHIADSSVSAIIAEEVQEILVFLSDRIIFDV